MTREQVIKLIRILGLVAFAALLAVPLLCSNAYLTTTGVFIAIHAIIAVGLGLLMGYAGQISLGHAAFYGLGAYSSAILTTRFGLPPLVAMGAGIVITGLIALLVGAPALRLHGHYLAMFTLGLGIIASIVFNQAAGLTGGFSGIVNIPCFSIGALRFDTDVRAYVLALSVLALTIIMAYNLVNSRTGRALRALRESEVAASVCGIDVARSKLGVFVLSTLPASAAGSLYAHFVTFISPDPFGFRLSVQLLVMVVVGGESSVWGPVAGSALFTMLSQFLVKAGEQFPYLDAVDTMLFGSVLVVVVIFLQKGLVSLPACLHLTARSTQDQGVSSHANN